MDLQTAKPEEDRNGCRWKLAHLAPSQLHLLILASHHGGPDQSIHRHPNCRNQDPSHRKEPVQNPKEHCMDTSNYNDYNERSLKLYLDVPDIDRG